LWLVGEALRAGFSIRELFNATKIDPWFLGQIQEIIEQEEALRDQKINSIDADLLLSLKKMGFTDRRIAALTGSREIDVRTRRKSFGIKPSFKSVDTCAAEFEAFTPYLYSTYDGGSEAPPTDRKKIVILGAGPNRIGQGIEFDYCCVHASMALRADGFETIMINCNPETVSTDYDTSDRLYFEPLTVESVMAVVERENPFGVIVQFGGQTPLRISGELAALGVPVIGTSVESIDIAEDRERFSSLVARLGLKQPPFATARSTDEAVKAARSIGFPLMIRPSFVLGGRAMRVIYTEEEVVNYMREGVEVSHDRPVLLDRFLDGAIEVDVDTVSDGKEVLIAGVMEHIEPAGIHSGDSSCCLPPQTLSSQVVSELRRQAHVLAKELGVVGLMNIQFAVPASGEVFILEVNPRASRTVPFVSKATGVPWAKVASRIMAGKSLREIGVREVEPRGYVSVKACVFPFSKFPGVDTILGPEMKSTGEVMGIHENFAGAFAKSQFAANIALPRSGTAFLSVKDSDKEELISIVRRLEKLGFSLMATRGTAEFLTGQGCNVQVVNKVREGSPHIVDSLGAGEIELVINTPEGWAPVMDSKSIRLVANELRVPTYTTIAAARAMAEALELVQNGKYLSVRALQDHLGLVS
jgi:carbamoyl-phosphate synthase large subunit